MLNSNDQFGKLTLGEQVATLAEPLKKLLDETEDGNIIFTLDGKRYHIQNKGGGVEYGDLVVLVEDEKNSAENFSSMNFHLGSKGSNPKVMYLAKFGDFNPGANDTWSMLIGELDQDGNPQLGGRSDYQAIEDYIKLVLSKRTQSQEQAKESVGKTRSSIVEQIFAENGSFNKGWEVKKTGENMVIELNSNISYQELNELLENEGGKKYKLDLTRIPSVYKSMIINSNAGITDKSHDAFYGSLEKVNGSLNCPNLISAYFPNIISVENGGIRFDSAELVNLDKLVSIDGVISIPKVNGIVVFPNLTKSGRIIATKASKLCLPKYENFANLKVDTKGHVSNQL